MRCSTLLPGAGMGPGHTRLQARAALPAAQGGSCGPISRVLFCTEDMESAYRRTKAVMAKQLPGVEVVQCHRTQAAEAIRAADVVVPIIVPVTAAMIEAAPRLKLIIQYGVGVDAIDVAAATAAGVLVANIPSAGTGNALSVAEHALFLALASLRQPAGMARSLAGGLIGIPEGRTLFGSTVLVIGYGAIARHIIARLAPFGARVLCLRGGEWGLDDDAQAAAAGVLARGVFSRDAKKFAAQADIVILAATLNPTSVGLIGTEFLEACKPGVHIVNIARGGLLDREAVRQGLASGKIGGMGLDVYWDEPYGSSPLHVDDGIAEDPRVYMTPHVAGVTAVSYQSMAERLTDEVERVIKGLLPTSPINLPPNMRLQCSAE